jgi:hypothetical protein
MPVLPKGKPLHEYIAAATANVPEMLARLKAGGFTGYSGFVFPGAEGVLLFEGGRMIAASFRKGAVVMSGQEAIEAIFGSIFSVGGTIGIYRISRELAISLYAYLGGQTVWRDKEIRFLDMRSLLSGMKARNFTGCLRVSIGERTSLIFYRHGLPLGFFHDGSELIETGVAEAQAIHGMRDARLDIVSMKAVAESLIKDLMQTVDIDRVWKETAPRRPSEAAG